MASRFEIVDIEAALAEKLHPTVISWNRLEGRPRTVDFVRALRAEVRDGLWMLTRQWQGGEFRGEDAGSPVFAKVHVATTRLTRFRPGSAEPQDFDDAMPLETQVEQQPLRFTIGRDKVALDLRLTLGRRWLKQIAPIGGYAGLFIAKYTFDLPDPGKREDAPVCAHAEVWQGFAAAAERAMDGVLLYEYLTGDTDRHAYDGIGVLDGDKPAIDDAATKFVEWVQRLFAQPETPHNPAWQPSRLEYRFACSAPSATGETAYTADEYDNGTLDWHSLDVEPGATLGPATGTDPRAGVTRTMIPVPVAYAGMPHPRWWTFEDGRTNFGQVAPGYHRPRQAALHRVRARLLERLVQRALHAGGGIDRFGAGPRGQQRVRGALLDRGGRTGPERCLAALEPVRARRQGSPVAARRGEPGPPADRAQGA